VLYRYSRQTLLREIGDEAQERLRASSALLVGCGALGTHAAESLARAGVGRLVIVDRDVVELSNLQRQALFDEADARQSAPKALAAERRLRAINSKVEILPLVEDLNPESARRVLDRIGEPPGVILDCTDNFETRYLLNDLAIERAIPLVYAGVVGARAMQMTILPERGGRAGGAGDADVGKGAPEGASQSAEKVAARDAEAAGAPSTPCLRCVFPEPPPPGQSETCETLGVLGPAASFAAALAAAEAIKILAGRTDLVRPVLHTADLFASRLRSLDLAAARDPDCPACGRRRFEFLDEAERSQEAVLCGRDSVQIRPPRSSGGDDGTTRGPDAEAFRLDLEALGERLGAHAEVSPTPFLLKARLREERTPSGEPVALTIFPDGRAIVGGVTDPTRARALYARYVGA